MRFRLLMPVLALTSTLAVAAPSAPVELSTTAPHFVDVYEYFSNDAQYEAWYTLTTQLRRNFDDICGDTFCEGDYSNIQSLDFRCSVEQTSGRIGHCVWVFAGSYEDIDADTGRINVQSHVWRCRAALAPRTSIDALLVALAGDSPLQATLPGTQATIYDGLADCL